MGYPADGCHPRRVLRGGKDLYKSFPLWRTSNSTLPLTAMDYYQMEIE
jgi:hypothetical protein